MFEPIVHNPFYAPDRVGGTEVAVIIASPEVGGGVVAAENPVLTGTPSQLPLPILFPTGLVAV